MTEHAKIQATIDTMTTAFATGDLEGILATYTRDAVVVGQPGMPVTGTIYGWLRNHDDFARMYRQARRMQADLLADQAWEIAQTATTEDVKLARLQFDVIRWRAAPVPPKAYREEDQGAGGFQFYVQDLPRGAHPSAGPPPGWASARGLCCARGCAACGSMPFPT